MENNKTKTPKKFLPNQEIIDTWEKSSRLTMISMLIQNRQIRKIIKEIKNKEIGRQNELSFDMLNTLRHSAVRSEVYQMPKQIILEASLSKHGAEYTGDLSALSLEEVSFIIFAVQTFKDLIEIYAVNELGYTDIWIVFPDAKGDEVLTQIGACQKFLRTNKLTDVHYMTLSPENICGEVVNPLVHITLRRDCGGD